MGHLNGHITAPVGIEDLRQTLGTSSADIGMICDEANINPASKRKPIRHANKGYVSDAEMKEANYAISEATEKSLILFDELGRGTATYDGMSLAQAILEHIHDKIKAKTMFSTHYHELTVLEKDLKQLKNVHVSALEEKGKVTGFAVEEKI